MSSGFRLRTNRSTPSLAAMGVMFPTIPSTGSRRAVAHTLFDVFSTSSGGVAGKKLQSHLSSDGQESVDLLMHGSRAFHI
jgi:hypothetical protein